MRKSLAAVSTLFFLMAPGACEASLGELMDIARAQKDAQAAYKEETETFERVKAGVESGAIGKGLSEKEIRSRYGEPVVTTVESKTGRERWIYKSAESSFFSGIKVYLYFDKDDKLDEIRVAE